MQQCSPIGVFDSGVGGLATLKDLIKALPGEDFIYFGDNANAPYGVLSQEKICELTFKCVDFLIEKGAKCVVIACNTASSAAVQAVRAKYELPIVAMEPAVKPAAAALKQGKALVLATAATLNQSLYLSRIQQCQVEKRMLPVPCPKFVELVEQGILEGPQVDEAAMEYLGPYKEEDIDVVVLGCTHFIHLHGPISKLSHAFWPNVQILDGNDGTAHQLKRVLEKHGLENPNTSGGTLRYFTSGDPMIYLPLFEKLMR